MNLFHRSVKNIHIPEIWLWNSIYKIDSFVGLTCLISCTMDLSLADCV